MNDLAFNYGLVGACYSKLNNYLSAETYYNKALFIFEKSNVHENLIQIYYEVTVLYTKQGKSEKALMYLNKYDSLARYIYSEENRNSISAMKTKFDTEKKEQENKLLQTKNQLSVATINQQKITGYFIIAGLVSALVLAFFVFNGLKKQRKANIIISEQKIIVENQKHLVEEKHKEITDSINYAERIQRSLLASKAMLDAYLNNYFILFKPKDVVSGDFYWAAEISESDSGLNQSTEQKKFALITADSTGHGVPGAIMSILNIACLNEAVKEGYTQPNEILNRTRKEIISVLKRDGSVEGGKEGMDASLIVFDFVNLKMTVAAANNPVWIIRTQMTAPNQVSEVIEIKPDKMPVGKHDKDQIPFTQHQIQLQKGDAVYTLTDGFSDQFGGINGKKFMSKNLRDILVKISGLPMQEQKQVLEKTFANWIGNLEQVDDVCIIGIRV